MFICFHCSPNHWYYLVIQAIVSQSWYVKDSPSKRTLTACLLHVEKGRPNSPSFIHSSFSYFYLLVIKTSIWHILRWQTFNSFLIIQGFNAYHVLCYCHLSLSPFLSLWVTHQLILLWTGRFGMSDCQKYFYRVKGHLWNVMASLPPSPQRMWHWVLGSCHCTQHTKMSSWLHCALLSTKIISLPCVLECIYFYILLYAPI